MFESLSQTQREIVLDKSGKFVVRACPGSGKTYCVSARLARLINNWKKGYNGIATVSFTNVAWQEIEKKYREDFQNSSGISFPHFIGTIDSFVNKYIFLPHGHLTMNCNGRPILVGEPHGSWTAKNFSCALFDNISYGIDGEFYAIQPTRMKADWKTDKYIIPAKVRLNETGYATQQDANYFAMKTLEKYPKIAKAIASRFPFLIVDEAQDTSDIQMRIIDLLTQNGLNEVMLVGDPDQAIFEWNEAKPELIVNKFHLWDDSIELNENRRSSQLICNFTHRISSLKKASTAVNEDVKNFNIKPRVITYKCDLPIIVNTFLDTCVQNGIKVNRENVSIIYRSKDMLCNILERKDIHFKNLPWVETDNFTKDYAKGKYLYDTGDFKNGFKYIEKAILKMYSGKEFCSDEMLKASFDEVGYINHKKMVFDILSLLPKTDVTLGEWINNVNKAFKHCHINSELKIKIKSKDVTFEELFMQEQINTSNLNYRIGTVHSVKGETFDATLLILKDNGGRRGRYANIIAKSNPPSDHEELRIVYVGLTRPRKLLTLAVPSDESKTLWENWLNGTSYQ